MDLRRLTLAVVAIAGAGACVEPAVIHHTFRGYTMGTTFAVTVVGADLVEGDARVARLESQIQSTLDDIEAKMSTFIADSEISRFNRSTTDGPFPVSAETLAVLGVAREISELTKGAFDVTVAPLVNAWGFGPLGDDGPLPSEEHLDQLMPAVGYRHLRIDPSRSTISKLHPGLHVDLSAIAKGHAVDRVAEGLNETGIEAYLIEVGGEVRARGLNPDGRLWRIGIERPEPDSTGLQRVVDLQDVSLATSGDYRNFIEASGHRVSHTIDPRTGRPIEHGLASVSVIDEQCARADALATALGVMGPDEAFALASLWEWPALLVVREEDGTYHELATPAFEALANPVAQ